MKRLYKKKLIILISLSIFGYSALNAQITVGSEIQPVSGSLLDIKSDKPDIDNITATKGMGLPRVSLTNKINLYPMFLGDSDYVNNTDNKKDLQDKLHTGLVVYNVYQDICEDIYPGVHVWDGKKWEPVSEDEYPSETDVLFDNRNPARPEYYKIGKFGNAGWWMLENLRADRWTDGTNTDLVFAPPISDQLPGGYDKRIYYPKLDPNDFSANPHHGYVYNFLAAIGLSKEEISNSSLGKRQGICPTGWHIPTLNEWVTLINEVRDNPCQYAHSKIGEEVGWNMQSMAETTNGRSRVAEQGGFNASLLGRLTTKPEVIEEGERAYFWLVEDPYTSVLSSTTAVVLNDISGAGTFPNAFVYMIPVRCIKD